MKENHHEIVRREFGRQAPRFGEPGYTLTSPEHLQWMVSNLDLEPHFAVLDVAAGTGHLGRAIAPYVKQVVALDATPEMLLEGSRQTEQDGITNMVFAQGRAEALPYPTGAFDLVVSRFAIHHFEDPLPPVQEMVRVCRPRGQVVVIDLVAPEDGTLAEAYNRLERMRDPSHARALPASGVHRLLMQVGLDIVRTVAREVEVNVDRWLTLTEPEPEVRHRVVEELTQELQGLQASGTRPFLRDKELMFLQTWFIAIGRKGEGSFA
ncbi:MAG: class I SAM-dependent methyltransferase [Candidatus Methylomirabilales bacterium]